MDQFQCVDDEWTMQDQELKGTPMEDKALGNGARPSVKVLRKCGRLYDSHYILSKQE